MRKIIFASLLAMSVLISCAKKEESTLSYMEKYTRDYIKNNPEVAGFYTSGDGKVSEIRYENDSLYYIEYSFDGLNYNEEQAYDIYFTFDAENRAYPSYNPYGRGSMRITPKGTRYETLEEAAEKNYSINFGKKLQIKSITATSVLIEDGKSASNYSPENLIDGTYKSWVEGEDGSGIGTKITVDFERPYYFQEWTNHARIYIQNGFGSLKHFNENNRVKEMNIWIDDSKTPVKVRLYDLHVPQCIVLRKYLGKRVVNRITFEILSVYPGTKYDDTCISEIRIGPFNEDYDYWGVNYPMDPYLAEITYAYYRDIEKNTSAVRINNGVFEEKDPGRHDPRPGWWPLNIIPTNYSHKEFDFYNETPIYVEPGEILNKKMQEENCEYDPLGVEYCRAFYNTCNLYTYKDNSWKIEKNDVVMEDINKVLAEHKNEFFTFRREDSWSSSDLYCGVNDNEDPNYSFHEGYKYLQFVFYKEPIVTFSDDEDNSAYIGTYKFVFNGTKYVLFN